MAIQTITIDTEQWAVVPRALLEEITESLACELDARYPACNRSYPSQERKYQAEMEPVIKARDILAAAPRPEPVQLANPSCLEAFTAFWDDYRFKSWGTNPHPQWPNNRTKENMPDQWCAIGKPYAWEAWRACWETAQRPVPTCDWQEDSDGIWETSCGEAWVCTEGTPTENDMRFCHSCGKHLKEHRHAEPDGGAV